MLTTDSSVAARCETAGLAAGAYSVVYGGRRAELTVPCASVACVERGAGAPAG